MNPHPFTLDMGAETRRRIMRAIVDYCSEYRGVAPTLKEIGQIVGRTSLSSISKHLLRLERDGQIRLIRTEHGGVAPRGIMVVGATWLPGGGAHVAAMAGGIDAPGGAT